MGYMEMTNNSRGNGKQSATVRLLLDNIRKIFCHTRVLAVAEEKGWLLIGIDHIQLNASRWISNPLKDPRQHGRICCYCQSIAEAKRSLQ
jgi:hypothetical protein